MNRFHSCYCYHPCVNWPVVCQTPGSSDNVSALLEQAIRTRKPVDIHFKNTDWKIQISGRKLNSNIYHLYATISEHLPDAKWYEPKFNTRDFELIFEQSEGTWKIVSAKYNTIELNPSQVIKLIDLGKGRATSTGTAAQNITGMIIAKVMRIQPWKSSTTT